MRVSAFVLLGCLGGATAAHAEPGDTLYTQENAVDVRHYPSADAPVVMQLDRGRKLVEIKREGPWAEVGVYRIGASGLPTGVIRNDGWVRSVVIGPEPSNGGDFSGGIATRGRSYVQPEPKLEPSREAVDKEVQAVAGTEFELHISGTPTAKFRSTCRLITEKGKLIRRKISGWAPKRFRFVARAVSCTVNNLEGRRLVVALKAGNKVAREVIHSSRASVRVWTDNFKKLSRKARRRGKSK